MKISQLRMAFTACMVINVMTQVVHAEEHAADTKSGANATSDATSASGADSGTAPGYHHSFNHAEHWVKIFDDPERDTWQKREQVITSLKLHANDKIADIGAGTGYFSVPLAQSVKQGKVYAVDTEPDMVKYLGQLSKRKGLKNLIAIKAETNDPKLPEKVNLALVVDTFHHIDSRVAYFSNLKRSLAPQARLAIIDFTHESKFGPPVEHRISKEEVTRELKSAGYTLEEELKFLPNQYFVIYRADATK